LLAKLGLGVMFVVVVVGRVGLASLGSKLVGDGALILGVEVLVAAPHAFLVGSGLLLGRGRVALVAVLIDGMGADVRLGGAVRHCVEEWRNRAIENRRGCFSYEMRRGYVSRWYWKSSNLYSTNSVDRR